MMISKFISYVAETNQNIENSDVDLDRDFPTPRPSLHGGVKLLIGAVVLNGAVIAGFTVSYFNQVTPLKVAHLDVAQSFSIAELAAIAPGSGMPLLEEIVGTELPLSGSASEVKNHLAGADNPVWRIQLASLRTQSDTQAVWTKLQQANPNLLDNLTLHVQSARLSNGTFYRVQAGPVMDKTAATSICKALKFRDQDCLVVVS